MSAKPTVFVVDDDSAVRRAIKRLLESVELAAEAFGSAQEFLESYDPDRPGCLILDVRMPGMSGLDLQELLARQGISIPVIIVTGHADVPMAVRALQMGATQFIEKPFNDQILLDAVKEAISQDAEFRSSQTRLANLAELVSTLTSREHEVMDMVTDGKANKVIASDLQLSHKTVEFHRANVMRKMGVSSVAELVQLVMTHNENSE